MEAEQLFLKLYNNNVRYLLCGGLAVNIYGIPRMTADIDILIDFNAANIASFETTVKKLGYKSILPLPLNQLADVKLRDQLISEKNLIAYSYFGAMQANMSLDVIIFSPLSFSDMWAEKEERSIDDAKVFLVSVNHLKLLKQNTGREQDKQDIINLNKFYPSE
jgi:hypothetical protein